MQVEQLVVERLAAVGVELGQALDAGAQAGELALERGVAERRDVDEAAQLVAALLGPAFRVVAEALRLGLRPALWIVAERHRRRA